MLYWNTVNSHLKEYLLILMKSPPFADFRLVGGTALSLHLGHRMSVDIDLFTDREYGTIDFGVLEDCLSRSFSVVQGDIGGLAGFGKSYLIGADPENLIKLDIYYSSENFIRPLLFTEGVRLADIEDIIAMKVDVILRGGRKKDFWDLHELMERYTLSQMLMLHQERHPFTHDKRKIIANFTNFDHTDKDFNPICLRGKHWEFIRDDFRDWVNS